MNNKKSTAAVASRRIVGISTFIVFASLAVNPTVFAAEWRIEPLLRVAADFDDNPVLSIRTDLEESVSGYIAEAAAKVAYASVNTDFFITPRLRTINYGEPTLDSDDQFLRFNLAHRTTLTNFRISGSYARESTRTAERADVDLDVEDPDEIPDDDSGTVAFRGRRERMEIIPYFSYSLSNVSSLSASVTYNDVSYDDVFLNILSDYVDSRARLSYRRDFSSRNTGILTATYRNFEPDGGESVAGVGIMLGLDRRLSEKTRFRVAAGIEDTEISAIDTDANWVADVSISRFTETTALLAQYRRTISASGLGSLTARDSISLNFSRRLSELISAGIGARLNANSALVNANSIFDERNYVQLSSQFTWHISQVFTIEVDYRYTFLDRDTLGESSNSNRVSVWFNYAPRPFVRSR